MNPQNAIFLIFPKWLNFTKSGHTATVEYFANQGVVTAPSKIFITVAIVVAVS